MSTTLGVETRVADAIAQGIFAGTVLVAGDDSGVRYHEAFGRARVVPASVAMRPDSQFDVASLTKVVATTTAAAICLQAGLIKSGDLVKRYLPALAGVGTAEITIQQLATHTAGFGVETFPELTGEAVLAAHLAAPVRYEPGRGYEYSCRGFFLLTLIVEKVTGQPFAQFCQERIFGPLEMTGTRFGPVTATDAVVGTTAPSGVIEDGQARSIGRPMGNAGLFTTAGDLGRFAQMMLGRGYWRGRRILNEGIWAQITCCLTPAGFSRRAFGWDMRDSTESPLRPTTLSDQAFGHMGWTGQMLWIDPVRRQFLAILTNRTHPDRREQQPEEQRRAVAAIGDALLAAL